MIKYFHELTKAEFEEIVRERITWKECAERYPQPPWCGYPDAVSGIMGCWSLMNFWVTGEDYCKGCDCYIGKPKEN
jgi:hypothetical protein